MTLREFVKAYMEATENKSDLDEMIKKITEEAKKVAQGGSAVLTEEDVEKIIDGHKLKPIPATQKAEKAEANKQTSKPQKVVSEAEAKPQKKTEKKPEAEQMSLFDFQV